MATHFAYRSSSFMCLISSSCSSICDCAFASKYVVFALVSWSSSVSLSEFTRFWSNASMFCLRTLDSMLKSCEFWRGLVSNCDFVRIFDRSDGERNTLGFAAVCVCGFVSECGFSVRILSRVITVILDMI